MQNARPDNPAPLSPERETAFRRAMMILWAGLAVAGIWYFHYFSTIAYDSDLAILTSFAGRMLDGHQFTQMYYETNPPLSMIIYAPAVLLARAGGLEIYTAHFIYSLLLFAVSCGLTGAILRHLTGIDGPLKHCLFLGYVVTQALMPGMEFGDRDHLIFMGVVPFLLGQIALYQKAPVPMAVLWGAFFFGAILILIKPHYGLIPTVFLLHRFIMRDRFKIVMAPDFLALAICVLAYAAVLLVFFADYLAIALPDSAALYAGNRNEKVWEEFIVYLVIWAVIGGVLTTMNIPKREQYLLQMMALVTALFFIPYIVQGKVLNYQRIPHLSMIYITVLASLYVLARPYLRGDLVLLLAVPCLAFVIFNERTGNFVHMTHDNFRKLPLSQALDRYCPAPCRYFLMTDTSENIYRLETYHHAFHASRFSAMWYLPPIIRTIMADEWQIEAPLSAVEAARLSEKYTAMAGEDLMRLQPGVIIWMRNFRGYRDYDFLGFYKQNPMFREAFAHYDLVDTITFDEREYYPGMNTPYDLDPFSTYDIYVRKADISKKEKPPKAENSATFP